VLVVPVVNYQVYHLPLAEPASTWAACSAALVVLAVSFPVCLRPQVEQASILAVSLVELVESYPVYLLLAAEQASILAACSVAPAVSSQVFLLLAAERVLTWADCSAENFLASPLHREAQVLTWAAYLVVADTRVPTLVLALVLALDMEADPFRPAL
jgi:hypothetical protein